MIDRWRYDCPFVNRATGERRVVRVELTSAERADAVYHWDTRGPEGPGGPNGPIARGRAMRHAELKVPAGFEPLYSEFQRVPPLAAMH